MFSLNLLSPTKKQQASKQMIFMSLQFFASWILIIVCIAGIILLITKLVMQNSFSQAVRQGALVTKEYGELNQKVYAANKKIKFLQIIQKNFIVWSPNLAILTTLAPKDIELASININHTTKDIIITGHAKKRENLMLYKSRLEQSPLLEKVDMPIENLLKATDIDFKITGKLKV